MCLLTFDPASSRLWTKALGFGTGANNMDIETGSLVICLERT
jgi:hypothetical protein